MKWELLNMWEGFEQRLPPPCPVIRTRCWVSIFALPWSVVISLSQCLAQLPALYPLPFQCQDVSLRISFTWSCSPASLPGTSSSFSSQPLSSFMPVESRMWRQHQPSCIGCYFSYFQLLPWHLVCSFTFCFILLRVLRSLLASTCLSVCQSLLMWPLFVKRCMDLSRGDEEVTLP